MEINNTFYETLGEKWYTGDRHPVGILRAEAKLRVQFIREILRKEAFPLSSKILDVACGGGLVSNPLGRDGYHVTGVDLSGGSIEVARAHAPSGVEYLVGDAYDLPVENSQFDAILMMDFLEHVEFPAKVILEASGRLRRGGLLFFSTFNRNLLSRLLAVHAINLLPESPKNIHVYSLLLKPSEVEEMGKAAGLERMEFRGFAPKFLSQPFMLSVLRRRIHPDFSFHYVRSLAVGYCGYFKKLA